MIIKRNFRKEKIGKVVKIKCNKSVIIRVDRILKHSFYGKFIKKTTKFMVHDENNVCKIGDMVKIMETRPISKNKRWRIVKIIKN